MKIAGFLTIQINYSKIWLVRIGNKTETTLCIPKIGTSRLFTSYFIDCKYYIYDPFLENNFDKNMHQFKFKTLRSKIRECWGVLLGDTAQEKMFL